MDNQAALTSGRVACIYALYIHLDRPWVLDRECLGRDHATGHCVISKRRDRVSWDARRVASEAERTSDFVYVLLTRSSAHVRVVTARLLHKVIELGSLFKHSEVADLSLTVVRPTVKADGTNV